METVNDLSGYNFIKNPLQEGTHIFSCWDGTFICTSPHEGERFKYMEVLRETNEDEENFLNEIQGS